MGRNKKKKSPKVGLEKKIIFSTQFIASSCTSCIYPLQRWNEMSGRMEGEEKNCDEPLFLIFFLSHHYSTTLYDSLTHPTLQIEQPGKEKERGMMVMRQERQKGRAYTHKNNSRNSSSRNVSRKLQVYSLLQQTGEGKGRKKFSLQVNNKFTISFFSWTEGRKERVE